jgi:hypothetical protein
MEKIAIPCAAKEKLCFYWWPILPEVPGWQQDRDVSFHYSANMLVPKGATFKDSESVMYVLGDFKERDPETKTISQRIANNHANAKKRDPKMKIVDAPSFKTAEGVVAKSFFYSPSKEGSWERLAFVDEPEYFIVFVLSSRSETGMKKAMADFELLVSRYKEKP